MRIYTCTPVEFGGGEDFFGRDSGLLSRGLRAIGMESKAVMPGFHQPEDLDELIRTEFKNLESADWWRAQELNGVVLYAWGKPKFRNVAKAIHEAEIFLVLNQDNGGLVSPLAGLVPWLREQWNLSGKVLSFQGCLHFVKLVLRGLSLGLFYTDPLRAAHLKHGDRIACVSPTAAGHYRKLCKIYGGRKLAIKVTMVPHAVEPIFKYDGRSKKRQIVTVGRWEDETQKRPSLLVSVITKLIVEDQELRMVVVGNRTPMLQEWHSRLTKAQQDRVELYGFADRKELAGLMSDSMIFYSPSAYESFGIAAAEALCSGCGVVAASSVSMASFDWFVSEKSGNLAAPDTFDEHTCALSSELSAWEMGHRDAAQISQIWCDRLHTDRVAEQVVALVKQDSPSKKQ